MKKERYIPTQTVTVEDLNKHLESIEKDIIEKTLKLYNNNISKAAEHLKVSRQNLQYKIKKYLE